VIRRLLDERDDRAHAIGRLRELQQSGIIAPDRDLSVQVLQQVARQSQLREDDEIGALAPGLAEQRVVSLEVVIERPKARSDLGKGDADGSHGRSV